MFVECVRRQRADSRIRSSKCSQEDVALRDVVDAEASAPGKQAQVPPPTLPLSEGVPGDLEGSARPGAGDLRRRGPSSERDGIISSDLKAAA